MITNLNITNKIKHKEGHEFYKCHFCQQNINGKKFTQQKNEWSQHSEVKYFQIHSIESKSIPICLSFVLASTHCNIAVYNPKKKVEFRKAAKTGTIFFLTGRPPSQRDLRSKEIFSKNAEFSPWRDHASAHTQAHL